MRLAAWRKQKGFSLAQAAEHINNAEGNKKAGRTVTRQQLHHLERGKYDPKLSTLHLVRRGTGDAVGLADWPED